jgi:hypothetical protein
MNRTVMAVEPSPVMIAQRRPDAAPAVLAGAEPLPFVERIRPARTRSRATLRDIGLASGSTARMLNAQDKAGRQPAWSRIWLLLCRRDRRGASGVVVGCSIALTRKSSSPSCK